MVLLLPYHACCRVVCWFYRNSSGENVYDMVSGCLGMGVMHSGWDAGLCFRQLGGVGLPGGWAGWGCVAAERGWAAWRLGGIGLCGDWARSLQCTVASPYISHETAEASRALPHLHACHFAPCLQIAPKLYLGGWPLKPSMLPSDNCALIDCTNELLRWEGGLSGYACHCRCCCLRLPPPLPLLLLLLLCQLPTRHSQALPTITPSPCRHVDVPAYLPLLVFESWAPEPSEVRCAALCHAVLCHAVPCCAAMLAGMVAAAPATRRTRPGTPPCKGL